MSGTSPPFEASGSSRYTINRVIFDLTRLPNARAVVGGEKANFISRYALRDEERQALLGPHWSRLIDLGVLPNLIYRYYMVHGLAPESFAATLAAEE